MVYFHIHHRRAGVRGAAIRFLNGGTWGWCIAQRGFVHLDQYAAFAHSDHGAIGTRWCCPVGLCSNGYPGADFRIYGSHGFNWRGLHDCDALIFAMKIRSGRTRYTDRGFLRHSGTFPDDGSRVPFVNLAVFHGIADPIWFFLCGDRVKCCASSCSV